MGQDQDGNKPRDRDRRVERLENFSDAVVAIAATVLVFPLLNIADNTDSLGTLLRENATRLFAFGLSFVVIYRFWLGQHRLRARVVGPTPALIWLNCAWLVTIVFLPFPTQLLGSAPAISYPFAAALYVGTMFATTLIAAGEQWLVRRAHEDSTLSSALISTAAMGLALVLTLTVPGAGLWPLLILWPANVLGDRFLRSRRRRKRQPHR